MYPDRVFSKGFLGFHQEARTFRAGERFAIEPDQQAISPKLRARVSSGIVTNGASFVLSLASSKAAPKQFFRLAFPCSQTPVTLSLRLSNDLVTVSWPSNAFRLATNQQWHHGQRLPARLHLHQQPWRHEPILPPHFALAAESCCGRLAEGVPLRDFNLLWVNNG